MCHSKCALYIASFVIYTLGESIALLVIQLLTAYFASFITYKFEILPVVHVANLTELFLYGIGRSRFKSNHRQFHSTLI